jgi:hypothetical protein
MALDVEYIRSRCNDVINHPVLGNQPDCKVQFVVPGVSSAATRRLCGRIGPRGENIADVEGGNLVVFKAHEVLKWIEKTFTQKVK